MLADPTRQRVVFAAPAKGRYFKFTALASADGSCANVAELEVLATVCGAGAGTGRTAVQKAAMNPAAGVRAMLAVAAADMADCALTGDWRHLQCRDSSIR